MRWTHSPRCSSLALYPSSARPDVVLNEALALRDLEVSRWGQAVAFWLGRLAVAGPIAFTLAWLVGGLVQDEYSFRQEDISALAEMDAQHAWIMITGFVLLGLGTVALGGRFGQHHQVPVGSRWVGPARDRRPRSRGGRVGAQRLQQQTAGLRRTRGRRRRLGMTRSTTTSA